MKSILITCTLLCSFFLSYAQEYCGATFNQLSRAEQQAALEFYQQLRPINVDSRAVDSVALTVHIVASTPGGGSTISQEEIEEQIEILNNTFGSGIVFFLCGSPRFYQGLDVYDFNSGDALNKGRRVANTVNVFIVEDLQVTNDFGLCGYARFPFYGKPEGRYVMMNLGCWNDGSTLTHELGHFYGLFHTHEAFGGFEYVDGSNCATAGDFICDTPADPNLSRPFAMAGCTYIGDFVDPKGDRYSPPVSNIMSYAPQPCTRDLTFDQKAVIRAVHENENSYLIDNCDFYPDFAVVPEFERVKIQSDKDIDITYTFETVGIDKTYDVDFRVLLKDAQQGSASIMYEEAVQIVPRQALFTRDLALDFPISKGTGEYLLEATLDYKLQVIERTETNNIARTIIEVDNSGLDDVVIFPNPVVDELKLFFRDKRATGAFDIRVFSYDGRLVLDEESFKNQEEFFQIIDVSNLNNGFYILKIDFEKVNSEFVFKFLKQ